MNCPVCNATAEITKLKAQTGHPCWVELRCGHEALMNPLYGTVSEEGERDNRRLAPTDDPAVLAHFAAQRDFVGAHPGTHDVGRAAAVQSPVEPALDPEEESEESVGSTVVDEDEPPLVQEVRVRRGPKA